MADIEWKPHTDSHTLKDEMKFLKEIQELKRAEGQAVKGELQKMMKSLGVGSEEEIDKEIADIKWKLHTDSH
eukprot:904452-Heterocapsa_arctica.AAC.1